MFHIDLNGPSICRRRLDIGAWPGLSLLTGTAVAIQYDTTNLYPDGISAHVCDAVMLEYEGPAQIPDHLSAAQPYICPYISGDIAKGVFQCRGRYVVFTQS